MATDVIWARNSNGQHACLRSKIMHSGEHLEPWHGWYSSARWQRLRARQLLDHPLCAMCAARGLVEPATIVDHIEPHRGDWNRFVTGKLQSLCKSCHDSGKRVIEASGYSTEIGPDGWPTDPQHPAYTATVVGMPKLRLQVSNPRSATLAIGRARNRPAHMEGYHPSAPLLYALPEPRGKGKWSTSYPTLPLT